MSHRHLGVALLAVLMALSPAVPTFASVPDRYPLVLGVSLSPPDNGLAALDGFMDSVGGHAPGIWSLWSDWGGADAAFPDVTLLDGIVARGGVPMLWWVPVDPSNLEIPGSRIPGSSPVTSTGISASGPRMPGSGVARSWRSSPTR